MQVDELRGTPMSVGSLEEIIDEKCAEFFCVKAKNEFSAPPKAAFFKEKSVLPLQKVPHGCAFMFVKVLQLKPCVCKCS